MVASPQVHSVRGTYPWLHTLCPDSRPCMCAWLQDYFEYEADNARVAKARGLSDQTSKEIAAWLEKNK